MGACMSNTEDDYGASPSPLEEKIISRLSSNSSQSLSSNGQQDQRKQLLEKRRKALAMVRKQRTDELQAKFDAGLFDAATLKQLKSIERNRKLMLNIHSGSASKLPTMTPEITGLSANSSPVTKGDDMILPHIATDISMVASFEASVLKPGGIAGEASIAVDAPQAADDHHAAGGSDDVAMTNDSFQTPSVFDKSPQPDLLELPPIPTEDNGEDPNAVPDSLSSSDRPSLAPTQPSESVEQRALQLHRTPILVPSPRNKNRKLVKSDSNPFTDDSKPGRRVRFCLPNDVPDGGESTTNTPPELELPSSASINSNTQVISVPAAVSKLNRHRSSSGTVLVRESRRQSLQDLLLEDEPQKGHL
ncbi:Hypothetical protein, putative [Bodo saltans]|uniref:Uncharacterized protein n=1 Tax=Bodo saltans TaxID=75058 RepID=A0A0S4IL05_BODSA|nr:Hypothetical protein, putative [Bodo saltans]|eukprot:CUE70024.1 Hypothetical protein, putative [Bodo saltans]